MQENHKIRFTYLIGKISATLVIPLEIATRNGLNKPSEVTVEQTTAGILIKRKKVID